MEPFFNSGTSGCPSKMTTNQLVCNLIWLVFVVASNKFTLISAVKFEIGGDRDPKTPTNEEESDSSWDCVWKCHTATPVHHMAFSPDGTLFATSGKSDRLVKVWYENKHSKC